ncbi:MAG TPA: tetratricopeptide repeat protein [Accumulibacter sp.]|uniref:tetratricopeptide repeat protein n=1 Tax=Accumulibacter sp. TaxID=2053492 RepID=UPI0025EB6A97|nr:tetratricopeptide repeat protein [Accumulibacter sp.]MCM8600019.1 tetratricopeptide repeat protein [Accumulibacter sp.]MCM8664206.1 tetratricopeptide repeat protein [Accumulibacter sp.]HNC53163.1 tetratricopeptide repeat protein [Accumulibacter sp.]
MLQHPSHPLIRLGLEHHRYGRFALAEQIYTTILASAPDHAEALYYLGVLAQQTDDHRKACEWLRRACAAAPDSPLVHFQLALSLAQTNAIVDAIASYRRALSLNPAYVEAHCNLGNLLKHSGDIEGSIDCYRRALQLAPTLPQIHYNLGILFQEQLQPEEAAQYFGNVIRIRADHAAAHNALGAALSELGRVDEAIECYRKAQALEPNSPDAWFNMHALLLDRSDLSAAIGCLQKATEIAPANAGYRFFLGLLHDYEGRPEMAHPHFDACRSDERAKADLEAWNYLKTPSGCKLPALLGYPLQAIRLSLICARVDGLVLEFGVFHGKSIRQIASLVGGIVHGFDSFQGLPEDWNSETAASYSTRGVLPDVPENVRLHVGWFEESIPRFLREESGPVRFINIDCDLYRSTKTVLEGLAGRIVPGTVIVFDEYIGHPSWRDDECKAFSEAAVQFGWSYEIVCFSFVTKQVAVRILHPDAAHPASDVR